MVIMFKRTLFLLVFCTLFTAVYLSFPSKAEQDILLLKNAFQAVDDTASYNTSQVLESNNTPFTWMDSRFVQDPFQMDANVKVKLNEDTYFRFHAFFQPDILYVYSPDSNAWNKVDYTQPAALQLQPIRNPIDFWLRRMKNVSSIEKSMDSEHIHFKVNLSPFNDDLYGVVLQNLDHAEMEVWTTTTLPIRVERAELRVHFTPRITNYFNDILYRMEVGSFNTSKPEPLPKEAQQATKLSN